MAQAAPNLHSDDLLLDINDLRKSFGGVHALRGVSFSLQAGEVHALVGENGANRSTLITVLSGVPPYDAGTILLGGESLDPHFAKGASTQVVH